MSGLIADGDYRSWSVQFVHPSLPVSSEADGVEPDMCTPIDPTLDHPSAREPLHPTSPFPWSGCYHHSSSALASVRTHIKKKEATPPIRLVGAEGFRLGGYEEEDSRRQEELVKAYRAANLSSTSAVPDHDEIPPETPQDDAISIVSSLPPGSEAAEPFEEPEDSDGVADFFIDAFHNEPPETMVVVNATFDLSGIDAPTDPAEFFKEKEYLEQSVLLSTTPRSSRLTVSCRLEKESRTRSIQRARKIDDEAYSNATPKGPKSKRYRTFRALPSRSLLTLSERDTSGIVAHANPPRRSFEYASNTDTASQSRSP